MRQSAAGRSTNGTSPQSKESTSSHRNIHVNDTHGTVNRVELIWLDRGGAGAAVHLVGRRSLHLPGCDQALDRVERRPKSDGPD